ncbi:MAG TPA: hypothetical protein VF572_04705 [Candidatus Saccharimonadales bacterium]|jgi:hypothetical protein
MKFNITKKTVIPVSVVFVVMLIIEAVLMRMSGRDFDAVDIIALASFNAGAIIAFTSSIVASKLNKIGLPEDGKLRSAILFDYNLNRLPEDAGMDTYFMRYAKAQLRSIPQYKMNIMYATAGNLMLILGILLWFRHEPTNNFIVIAILLSPVVSHWLRLASRKKVAEKYIASFGRS